MGAPHVLIIPFPAQGHVIPFMALAHCLADHGFKITFVNTDFNHARVSSALSTSEHDEAEGIRMVSIPDGLAAGEDRNDLGKLVDGFTRVMPPSLEELIRRTNESEDHDEIRWMVADENMGWAFAVAKKMGIRAAAYWCASAACLAMMLSIPKLIQDGVIDDNGLPQRDDEEFQLSAGMPPIKTTHFSWNCAGDSEAQKIVFKLMAYNNDAALELAEFIFCNSFHEVEPHVFTLFPNLLPIGPLLTRRKLDKPVGHFWRANPACLHWLDGQSKSSVIYVAFGSFTVFEQQQFQELALGLELSGRPFLWVVRPNLTDKGEEDDWFDGFRGRVAGRGMLVEWSPQQQVLAHPSVACFVSHCGWNSTMEGVVNGVPFLCWPYFTDQFVNQSYICNVWKTGLSVEADGSGIITREEIKEKLQQLLGDDEIRAKTLLLKESAQRSIGEGGSSYNNLKNIVEVLKESKGVESKREVSELGGV